mgnify:CR=1 FL=1
MADPIIGWRVLADCLKSGGLMKIGLYSELARQDIVKVRSIIAEKGFSATNGEIRQFRTQFFTPNNPIFNSLKNFRDLYSTSELRDLLFHVQEHRFSIPQIAQILKELSLTFIGFELHDKQKIKLKT